MRKIDDAGIILSKYQSGLFEKSVEELNCSSAYFYKKFASSKLAHRMDNKAFIQESLDIMQAFEEMKKEANYNVGKEKISPAILAWAGYLLRYWSYTYEISTKRLYKIIKLKELSMIYEAYHSLDIEEAINRINEAKKIKYLGDKDYKMDELKKLIK